MAKTKATRPKPKGDGAIPKHHAQALARSVRKLLDTRYGGSQREMERQTSFKQSTISDLLHAGDDDSRRGPGLVAVLRLHDECGVSLDALFELDTLPIARVEDALRQVLAEDRKRVSEFEVTPTDTDRWRRERGG